MKLFTHKPKETRRSLCNILPPDVDLEEIRRGNAFDEYWNNRYKFAKIEFKTVEARMCYANCKMYARTAYIEAMRRYEYTRIIGFSQDSTQE